MSCPAFYRSQCPNSLNQSPGLCILCFNSSLSGLRKHFNPLMLESAMWHKMPLHAQYFIIFSEIFTNKRSQKDLHIQDLIYHSCNLKNFFLCTVLVELISYNNGCSESCNLSYSLVVYLICTWKKKSFVFHFSVLTHLFLFSYHLHTCWCHLQHNPKIPFK